MAYRPYQGIAQPKPQKPSYAEWWEPVAANALSLPLALTERLVGAGIDQTVAPGGAVWDAFSTQGQVDKYNQEVVDAARAREMAIAEQQIGLDFLPREKESSLDTAVVQRAVAQKDSGSKRMDAETNQRTFEEKKKESEWTRDGNALPPGQSVQGSFGGGKSTQHAPRARGGGGGSSSGNDMYVVSKDGQVYPAAMYEEVAKNTRDELAKLESVAEGYRLMGIPPGEIGEAIAVARGRVDDLRYAAKVKDPRDASRLGGIYATQTGTSARTGDTIESREKLAADKLTQESTSLVSKLRLSAQKANASNRLAEAKMFQDAANNLADAVAKAAGSLGTPRATLNVLEAAYQDAARKARSVPDIDTIDVPGDEDKKADHTKALQLLEKYKNNPKKQEEIRAIYKKSYGEDL